MLPLMFHRTVAIMWTCVCWTGSAWLDHLLLLKEVEKTAVVRLVISGGETRPKGKCYCTQRQLNYHQRAAKTGATGRGMEGDRTVEKVQKYEPILFGNMSIFDCLIVRLVEFPWPHLDTDLHGPITSCRKSSVRRQSDQYCRVGPIHTGTRN